MSFGIVKGGVIMANIYNIGDVVKYRKEWCTKAETSFRFAVVEVRDHSTDKDLNRCDYLVSMIMTPKDRENHPFGWFETVSEYMIERG